jgi:hypothetical protein
VMPNSGFGYRRVARSNTSQAAIAPRPMGVCENGFRGLKNKRHESAAALAGLKAARPSSYQW